MVTVINAGSEVRKLEIVEITSIEEGVIATATVRITGVHFTFTVGAEFYAKDIEGVIRITTAEPGAEHVVVSICERVSMRMAVDEARTISVSYTLVGNQEDVMLMGSFAFQTEEVESY